MSHEAADRPRQERVFAANDSKWPVLPHDGRLPQLVASLAPLFARPD